MNKLVTKVYGYELRVGDSIAVKYNENTGRVSRSVEILSIRPPSKMSLFEEKYEHNHTNHIHINMGEGDQITGCWDMFSLVPVVINNEQ